MVFDNKFTGMGIDQCTGNLFQQCNAAMRESVVCWYLIQ
jgi:hypothetical protein